MDCFVNISSLITPLDWLVHFLHESINFYFLKIVPEYIDLNKYKGSAYN